MNNMAKLFLHCPVVLSDCMTKLSGRCQFFSRQIFENFIEGVHENIQQSIRPAALRLVREEQVAAEAMGNGSRQRHHWPSEFSVEEPHAPEG